MRMGFEHGDNLRDSERGYSLAEVLVATGILAASILPAMSLFTQSLQIADRGDQREKLVSAAQNLLEEIRLRDFRDPEGTGFGVDPGEDARDKSTFDDVDDFCGWTETVREGGGTGSLAGGDPIRLTVTVWYGDDRDQDGRSDTNDRSDDDNGEILLRIGQPPGPDPCAAPGEATRFKAIRVEATSEKFGPGNPKNVPPLILFTMRFQ